MKELRTTHILRLFFILGLFFVLGLALFASVSGAQEAETSPSRAKAGLRPVPYPDLEALESDVAEQLGKMQVILRSIMESAASDPQVLHDAYNELGRLYHAYDLTAAAEVCYLNALRIRPRDFDSLYLLTVLRQQTGRLEEAEATFQTVLELRPDDLASLVRLADIYRLLDRPDYSAKLLQHALKLDPECAAVRAALGELALAQGDNERAVTALERALELVPAANRLHYPLGLAYRALGDRDQARQHLALSGTVGVQPPDPLVAELETLKRGERVHLLRGRMAFGAGRYREAANAFAVAVAARPESARARINLGTALGILGDRTAAKAQYREALKLEPGNRTARFNLGSLLAEEGAYAEAAEHLEAAVAADESDSQAHIELAEVLRRGGLSSVAREHYAKAVELDPLNDTARLGEASALVDEGRYAEARQRLEAAHAVSPHQGLIAHALARLLAGSPEVGLRDGARALELAQSVFGAQPTPGHAATMAMALAEVGRCDEAAQFQRQAVEALEEAGQPAAEVRQTLAHYEQSRPCRYME